MFQLRLLQLLVLAVDRVPVSVLYAAANVGATLAWYASSALRATTRDHMRHVFPAATPRRTIDAAARGAVRSAAYYWVDLARYGKLRPDDVFDHVDSIEGVPAVFEAYDRGRGLVLENGAYSEFDLRAPQAVSVNLFSPRLRGGASLG